MTDQLVEPPAATALPAESTAPARPAAAVAPDDSDRALAAVAHILGWITGVVILVVGQNRSAFVRFHALQALVVDLAMTVAGMVFGFILSCGAMALVMGTALLTLPLNGEPNGFPRVAMPAMFMFMFPCIGLLSLVPLGLRVYAIIRAATGHLYAYPLIDRWLKPGP